MWKLNKPCVITAVGKDIDELTKHCNALGETDKPVLSSLYIAYDNQGGMVSESQLSVISEDKAIAISGQYNKTHTNGTLDYIRTGLMKYVDLCPCCSINEPSQLDHFMPESKYKALSVCRLNLIPTCGECNNKKSDDDYRNYIHAYYQKFPVVPFLLADVSVEKLSFVVKYRFDLVAINDDVLDGKLNHQAEKTNLWNRLRKSANTFVSSFCNSCFASDSQSLNIWLKDRLAYHEKTYGLNDWRTAVVRGIIDCKQLDIDVVNNYKINSSQSNGGAGA